MMPIVAAKAPNGEPRRFFEEVVLNYEGDECLLWPFGRRGRGYGTMIVAGKNSFVHRVLCEEVNGPPTSSEHQAGHRCGNGHLGCVTKRHLSWKTPSENQMDRLLHGTHSRGERNPTAKLTEADVIEILTFKGEASIASIAERYSVSQTAIREIHSGKRWSWLG
jgi:hypothetical protein